MSSKLNPYAPEYIPENDDSFIFIPITDPDRSVFEYPFSFISNNDSNGWATFDNNEFSEGLVGEEKCDAATFPDNITEFYWIHPGCNDEEPWEALCKLDNGNFAFYSAWCDYTGFDCQGGMKLIVSRDLKRLFYEGLTEEQRRKCIADKKGVSYKKPRPFTDDWKFEIPVPPKPNILNPTSAFVRIWENGKELILTLDHVNGLEMEALEYAVRGLTAKYLSPKGSPKPKKHFYNTNFCSTSPSVYGIDEVFIRRFGNPNKKWELKMRNWGGSIIRKWGKVEVSFIPY